jgi:carbamoyl-phosphate synthase large subunit
MTPARRMRVGVTGLHLGENCQPGPGVVRSLRQALGDEVELVGLAYDVFDSALYAPGLDDAYMIPYPSAGPSVFAERLLEIQAIGGLDVLLPSLDVELPVVQRLAPALAARGIRTCLPSPEALARRTKDQLPALAAAIGIAVPETLPLSDHGALAEAGHQLGFPMVVKGPFYEAEVVHSAAEAATAFDQLAARWGLPLLAQRFVKGEEFDVIALGDGAVARGPVAMRKTVITRMGKAWGAVTVHDDELLEVARRVVAELRWRGGCEVEMLRGVDDGELYLIEVNPRFPAWVYLATAAGKNLPLGLLRLALDEPLPDYGADGSYRAGVFYVRHAAEAVGDLTDIEALMTSGRARRGARSPLFAASSLESPHV